MVIKVSVFYPNGPEARFDRNYYCAQHIPWFSGCVAPHLKSTAVERGLAGATPGSAPAFLAMGHPQLESVEAFQASFGPHTE